MKLRRSGKWSSSVRSIIAVTVGIVILLAPQYAAAGLWAKIGALLTTIGVTAGALGAAPVAAVGVGAEVVCMVIDAVQDPQAVHQPDPPILGPPDWDTFGHESLCLGTTFQPFDLPGDDNDTLIMAVNTMLARCNAYMAAISTGAPRECITPYAVALSNAIRDVKCEYDKRGYGFAITQNQLDSSMADIAANGLPQAEIDLLANAGWSPADIQAMQNYVTGSELNLAVTSVTLSKLLEIAANLMFAAPDIQIPSIRALSGQPADVRIEHIAPLGGSDGTAPLGGFDLLVSYDPSAMTFVTATRGALLDSLKWEYFTFRTGANGNCNGGCPSGLVHLIAIADLDNGPQNHPIIAAAPGELAVLQFRVSSDRNLIGQCIPVRFYWIDCGDNAVANVTGDTIYVDASILDADGSLLWDEADTVCFPKSARPWGLGTPDSCLSGGGPNKPSPVPRLRFRNGWVCIRPPVDDRGDINQNGVANEIGDAVLFSNFFIYGIDQSFAPPGDRREAQKLATDVNDDGIVLTVADLVYLIRIITGDAQPFPKGENPKLTPYQEQAGAIVNVGADRVTVTANSPVDLGGAVFTFRYSGLTVGTPILSNAASQMVVQSKAERGELRVLVAPMMDVRGARIGAGANEILSIPTEGNGTIELVDVQMSDAEGNLLTTSASKNVPTEYTLLQNYPNPFNAGTIIPFGLKEATDWKLNVYNVNGQTVRSFSGHGQGQVQVAWDGTDNHGRSIASGVYFYRLETKNFTATKKMTLMK